MTGGVLGLSITHKRVGVPDGSFDAAQHARRSFLARFTSGYRADRATQETT